MAGLDLRDSSAALRHALADPASGAGGTMIGWKSSAAGAVTRTVADKLGEHISAADFGAIGNGTADDTAAVVAANAATGYVNLLPGKTYRIASNASVKAIVPNGGCLTIDSGVTLTFDTVVGDPATVVFKGAGIAKPSTNNYSVGWYDGDYANLKWDFCRRGFSTGSQKMIVWPHPLASDPAASVSPDGSVTWKCSAPIIFDDPENESIVYTYGAFWAANPGMTCLFEFSPANKTEDITFPLPLTLDAGGHALDCMVMHAGARIQFHGIVNVTRAIRDGIYAPNDLSVGEGRGFDEIYFKWLQGTNNGRWQALNIESSGGGAPYGFQADYIFNNGAKGLYGTAIVSGGTLTGITIPTNGPNGSPQILTGYGYSGQTFAVYSLPGTGVGYGATATATLSGDAVTGFTVTAGGSGFVNGETICITSAPGIVRISGFTRALHIGRIFENQDTNSNLVSISDQYMLVETASSGASQGLFIGPIQSIQGRRPALVTRDTTGSTVSSKHRFSVRGWRIANPMYDGGAVLRLGWTDEATVSDPPAAPPNTNIVDVTSAASSIRFQGLAREWVNGDGDCNTFDGWRMLYRTAMLTNTAISISDTLANVAIGLRKIWGAGFVDNNSTPIYFEGLILGDNAIQITSASQQIVAATGSLTGTTGTSGKITISVASGRFYLENRYGTPLRIKAGISL